MSEPTFLLEFQKERKKKKNPESHNAGFNYVLLAPHRQCLTGDQLGSYNRVDNYISPTQWFYSVPYLHLFLEFYSEKISTTPTGEWLHYEFPTLYYWVEKLMVMFSLWFTTKVWVHPSEARSQK